MFFDPMYLLIVGPAFLLSIIAQIWVKSAFSRFSKVGLRTGMSGAEAASRILQRAGVNVRVERVGGFLSDHYDPRTRVLRLSPDVYEGRSLASVGVAAHEAGHALQHATGYALLQFRTAIVPVTQIGSQLAFPLLFIGLIFQSLGLVYAGILLFSFAVLFQIVTLPVEIDASRRALQLVRSEGIVVSDEESSGARKVLTAAAMTYIAAAASAILTL
ncbi:MAG: zinc metallopeptidase, partial [Candidatus Eisenbacteria bacterium]|nr:zinc metallopeptidase [Candidatus Eisenbacteria bacterium]